MQACRVGGEVRDLLVVVGAHRHSCVSRHRGMQEGEDAGGGFVRKTEKST